MKDLISINQALAIIRQSIQPIQKSQMLALERSGGRICDTDYYSDIDYPPFHKSAMDGYGVVNDQFETYRIKEIVKAGDDKSYQLQDNECVQIMTGAPVLESIKKIIINEHVQRMGNSIKVIKNADAKNICYQGEDINKGELLIRRNTLLNPFHIGCLASIGVDPVSVYEPIKIDILITGDELVPIHIKPGQGKIRDINTYTLKSRIDCLPFAVNQNYSVQKDNLKQIMAQIKEFTRQDSNVLLISGGASVGDFDYTCTALKELDYTIHFEQIKIKPGKPTIFAQKGQKYVFGLPGNPVSVLVVFEMFVKPALYQLSGINYETQELTALLGDDWKRKKAERTEFIPVRLKKNSLNQLECEIVNYNGSGNIMAFHDIQHLMRIDAGVYELDKGEWVNVRQIWQNY